MNDILILIGSLAALSLGAEALVRGAVAVAERLGVSSFFIGLTIVGFGTSAPELVTSIAAALRGAGDIVMGNVVGSNIFNIAVILGLAAVICPIPVRLKVVKFEAWVVIVVAMLPWLALVQGGRIGRPLGALFVLFLMTYLCRGYRVGRRAHEEGQRKGDLLPTPPGETLARSRRPGTWVSAALVVAGIAVLAAGSHYFVLSASNLARALGVSDLVIGLTIVAAGTSAPELLTSMLAALRRQPDVSIGNILGSNVFNIAGILGLTCLVRPQEVSRQVLLFDAPFMLLLSIGLLPIMSSGSRISRAEGAVMIVGYVAYAVTLYLWAPAWFSP